MGKLLKLAIYQIFVLPTVGNATGNKDMKLKLFSILFAFERSHDMVSFRFDLDLSVGEVQPINLQPNEALSPADLYLSQNRHKQNQSHVFLLPALLRTLS